MGAIIDGEVLLLAFGVVAKLVIVAAVGATAEPTPVVVAAFKADPEFAGPAFARASTSVAGG